MSSVAGTAESYWMESTPATAYPPLSEDLDVDVVIVGGGIAGLCTAWELVEAGRSVAVLEADGSPQAQPATRRRNCRRYTP